MRFRGIAGAVLVGWILIAPSLDCARQGLQSQTPISEWDTVDSFSSREACEDYRATVIAAEKSSSDTATVEQYSYSICVQADDPRLKAD